MHKTFVMHYRVLENVFEAIADHDILGLVDMKGKGAIEENFVHSCIQLKLRKITIILLKIKVTISKSIMK